MDNSLGSSKSWRSKGAVVAFSINFELDLLPLARRLWRDRLPSRTLKYLEENVLAAPRTTEEVPGYEIPWLYFDYLRTRDATPLKGVFYHNAMDVVAMAGLLNYTAAMLAYPFHEGIEHALDVISTVRFLSLRKRLILSGSMAHRICPFQSRALRYVAMALSRAKAFSLPRARSAACAAIFVTMTPSHTS